MAQGGDITHGDGTGGYSIYGPKFADENLTLKHDKPYKLSMANQGKDSNGSQFFITFAATPWLDGHHQIFGEVIEGFDIIEELQKIGTQSGTPKKLAFVHRSGVL